MRPSHGRPHSPPPGGRSTLATMASHRPGRRRRPLAAWAVTAALLLALCGAGPAAANGDPASDVLTFQGVFFPFDPPVSADLQVKLIALTNQASAKRYPIRVAIIQSKFDLGSVPQLFGTPQRYARFLYQEITFVFTGQLLVVMPQGLGSVGPMPPDVVRRALAGLTIEPNSGSDGLARAAAIAVERLSEEAGQPLGGGGTPLAAILGASAAALAIGGAVAIGLRRRRRGGGQAG
jgi:hypothetical protein